MDEPVRFSPPSDFLLDVLAYTAGIRKLLDRPVDPAQIDHELQRIERAVAHVLGAIVGEPS